MIIKQLQRKPPERTNLRPPLKANLLIERIGQRQGRPSSGCRPGGGQPTQQPELWALTCETNSSVSKLGVGTSGPWWRWPTQILVAIYHMFSRQVCSNELGDLYLDELNKHYLTQNLVHRLERLGYTLTRFIRRT